MSSCRGASERQVHNPRYNCVRGRPTVRVCEHADYGILQAPHRWARNTPIARGPLKLARNTEGGRRRGALSIHCVDARHYTQHQVSRAGGAASRPGARSAARRETRALHVRRRGGQRAPVPGTAGGPPLVDGHVTAGLRPEHVSLTAGNFHTGPARDQDTGCISCHEDRGPHQRRTGPPADHVRAGTQEPRQAHRWPAPAQTHTAGRRAAVPGAVAASSATCCCPSALWALDLGLAARLRAGPTQRPAV